MFSGWQKPLRSWQYLSGYCHICTCNSALHACFYSFGNPCGKKGKADASQRTEERWLLLLRSARSPSRSCILSCGYFRSTLESASGCWDLSKLQEKYWESGLQRAAPVSYEHRQEFTGCLRHCLCRLSAASLRWLQQFPQPILLFLAVVFFPLHFTLLSRFSLCARPGSVGYGEERIMPSKAEAYSFQVCLYRGWVRHRRCGAPHCNAQSLQPVLVMESETLSAAKLQRFWWLCLLRIIRLVQYRHTHGCLYSFCNCRAHAVNPLWAPVKT